MKIDFDKGYYAGKTAAVTGAASGIGLALCELMLEYGAAKVVLADFNQANLDRETARLSAAYPGKIKGVLCNVTIAQQVYDMVSQAAAFGGGRLDILINCAGAGLRGKFLLEPDGVDPQNPFLSDVLTNEDWQKGFALNFFGPVHGCEAAAPLMIAQGGGQIVNIASGIAFSPMAYQSLYAATKAALVAFSYAIRAELADNGVKVNAATPGTTATAIFTGSGGKAPPEAQPPRVSAEKILCGAANNSRITLGDAGDEEGARSCFLPDDASKLLDNVYLNYARQRRSGTLSFAFQEPTERQSPLMEKAMAIIHLDNSEYAVYRRQLDEYAAMRNATGLEPSYYAGKTAVVTGGASGIGFALCQKLLECGAAKVALADYNEDNLAKREAELNAAYPGKAKGILCNVAEETSVQAMIKTAAQWFNGSFDLLINCAGVGQQGLTFPVPDDTGWQAKTHMKLETEATWQRVYAIDFYGPLYGCRAALPLMLKQGSGQIVNIISGTAMTPLPYQAIYSSAKAALNLTTLTLRYEFADHGVKFSAATPGTTATAIFSGTDIPEGAQTPEASAIRILTGVQRNERLIPGDDADLMGLFAAHNPAVSALLDEIFIGMARARKSDASVYGVTLPT